MSNGLVVLSLFDGMSCARIALDRAGMRVKKYYASEIDKHAIKVVMQNYPDTVQLGDVRGIDVSPAGIRQTSMLVSSDIPDILFAGFPCQDFSVMGKGAGFNGERGNLFFELVRIYEQCKKANPNLIFLFENVKMKPEWRNIISDYVGVTPILINSALVCAQRRERLYWTNIGAMTDLGGKRVSGIPQPRDRGIYLKHILESEVNEKYYLSDAAVARLKYKSPYTTDGKSYCLTTTYPETNHKTVVETFGAVISNGELVEKDKSMAIDANYHKGADNHGQRTVIVQHGRGKNRGGFHEHKSPTVTSSRFEKNHHVIQINESKELGGKQPPQRQRVYSAEGKSPALLADMHHSVLQVATLFDNNAQAGRVYSDEGKSITLKGEAGGLGGKTGLYHVKARVRRLIPLECERLQTVPENYTAGISDTQRYRMLGNGFNIDTIVHILSFR